MNNKLVLVTVMASILFIGAIGANIANAETYNCSVTVNGKGCIIAQKAKDDIKNTINIQVEGTGSGGGNPPPPVDHTADINRIDGDITALKGEQTTQNNDITNLQSADVTQDQNTGKLNQSVSEVQTENTQLRADLNALKAEFEDFKNNGTDIVVLPGNETGGGDNQTTTPPVEPNPPVDNQTTTEPNPPVDNQTTTEPNPPNGNVTVPIEGNVTIPSNNVTTTDNETTIELPSNVTGTVNPEGGE
jgi:uncharacterized coiled-coil protein SlyX